MTSKKIAQTNQQQKSEASQASGILQRTAVRSVADAGVQFEEQEALALSNSAFSKDFSRVPISTTQPQSIQAKLTIGEPGDKYEQEADRVASQVVQQINTPSAAQSTQGKSLQRQDAKEEEIQTKPSISVLQRSLLPTQVQLEAMPEDEELQAKSILQRRDARGSGEALTDVESAINSARSGGMPLDAGLQRSMGQAMGANFSGVKVHTDAQADQLNQSIQAKAFTTGQDVFFRQGEYNPGSRGGQELIAHELTHVVQQNGGVVQKNLENPIRRFQERVSCQDLAAQRIIQCAYADAVTRNNEIIYALIDPTTKGVYYIGRTSQDLAERKKQHDKAHPYRAALEAKVVEKGNWTDFETATHEQYWINYYASGLNTLDNVLYAIREKKFYDYVRSGRTDYDKRLVGTTWPQQV